MTDSTRPQWRDVNAAIFGPTVAAAAEQLGSLELAVEKDYQVCQALRAPGIADPTRILLDLGQSGGQHPFVRRPVVSLLARALGEVPSQREAPAGEQLRSR